jgi:hypothetical protein
MERGVDYQKKPLVSGPKIRRCLSGHPDPEASGEGSCLLRSIDV